MFTASRDVAANSNKVINSFKAAKLSPPFKNIPKDLHFLGLKAVSHLLYLPCGVHYQVANKLNEQTVQTDHFFKL